MNFIYLPSKNIYINMDSVVSVRFTDNFNHAIIDFFGRERDTFHVSDEKDSRYLCRVLNFSLKYEDVSNE